MSVVWRLCKVRPDGAEPEEGDEFDPEPFEPEEIDAILVGSYQGPFFKFHTQIQHVTEPGSDLYIGIFSIELVERFASDLASCDRAGYAPLPKVMELSGHHVREDDQTSFYDSLASVVDELRAFISSAAKEKLAVRMEVC